MVKVEKLVKVQFYRGLRAVKVDVQGKSCIVKVTSTCAYMSLCVRLNWCFAMVYAYLKSSHPSYYQEIRYFSFAFVAVQRYKLKDKK